MVLDPFVLPFFFLLAIVYGGLDVAQVIHNKGAKAIIAVAVAFAGALTPGVAEIVTTFMPLAAIFFIAVFFLGFVGRMVAGKDKDVVPLIVILGLGVIWLSTTDIAIDENILGLMILVILALLFYASYKAGGGGGH
jgi:hypothetical protein